MGNLTKEEKLDGTVVKYCIEISNTYVAGQKFQKNHDVP